MSKKSVAVRIAGHEYKILAEGDDGALRKIAADVDRAMNRVRERTGTVDTLDVAVLTCLNLAREIIELRNQSSEGASDERMRGLIDRVEALLPKREVAVTADATSSDADAETDKKSSPESSRQEMARTLDLPSFEALRDRAGSAPGTSSDSADAPMSPPRVAAGGGERAS